TSEVKDMIDQRMKSLLFQMNVFPKYIGDELLFLSRMSSMKEVANSPNHKGLENLKIDFLEFMGESQSYYQLRYIDESGNEVLKVENVGEISKVITEEEIQNKRDMDYFNGTASLSEGEIYLSELDLNIKQGKIENRGTKENPIYVPTLRVATPIYKKNKSLAGVLVLSIYADYFLNDVRGAQREGEKVFLINKDGFYLSNPKRDKEFAFMFNKSDNFFDDYPELSKENLLNDKKRLTETDKNIFSFLRVHPSLGDVGLIDAPKEPIRNMLEYYWILIAVSDKDILNKTINNLKSDCFGFLLYAGILIALIIALTIISAFGFYFYSDGRATCA
ncbi:MAG: cache domain-containing protein, partial [Nanoarchaeota archaeon]|nr:cache domain-containing protein [Nanoarchaeota archaeon]